MKEEGELVRGGRCWLLASLIWVELGTPEATPTPEARLTAEEEAVTADMRRSEFEEVTGKCPWFCCKDVHHMISTHHMTYSHENSGFDSADEAFLEVQGEAVETRPQERYGGCRHLAPGSWWLHQRWR